MVVCTSNCRKWTTFAVSGALVFMGVLLSCLWMTIYRSILKHELSLENSQTEGYTMWKETPIPMYLQFYLFNWTNSEEVIKNQSVKPIFVEHGPYTYYEHHIRENITFNDNNTVTFLTKRTWKFMPDLTKGSLDDAITTVNPIVATVGELVKYKHYLVRRGVSFFLTEKRIKLTVTKTVREFLFDGYEDPLLDLVHKLNITSFNVPFTKFGWFVDRNESSEYDGVFNMFTGGDDIEKLGRLNTWNYEDTVSYYGDQCSVVNGTTGELWYPTKDSKSIKLFATDLCSSVELIMDGKFTLHGVEGNRYIGTEKLFDNGTLHPDMICYNVHDVELPSGVRNVSGCKFGAPAFVSFPHFYEADTFYTRDIIGMKPDKEVHQMYIALEPSTGLPLKVEAKFQVNLRLESINGIDLLTNIKTRFMPIFWFKQTAELSGDLVDQAKILLVLPLAGQYTGYGLLAIGVLICLIGITITFRKDWNESEDEHILTQNVL